MHAQTIVEEWEPRPIDMIWAVGMIKAMSQRKNPMWQVRATGAVHRFDIEHKTLWLVQGDEDDIFEKNKIVFGMLGCRVLRQEDETSFSA